MGTILLRVPMRNIARGPTWLHAILPQAVFTVMNLPYTFFVKESLVLGGDAFEFES